MFETTNIFNTLLIIPILNALIGVYKLLTLVAIPGALGFSLIILTVIIRLILHPLTAAQLKSTQKMAQMKPHLDRLSAQYKNDKTRLQQEQLNLYKEAGINPASGCLPLLIQMPILIGLYNLFFQLLNPENSVEKIVTSINNVVYFPFLKIATLDLSFFGLNLAYKPSDWQKYGWFLLAIPVITALLQYYQTKTMMPPAPKAIVKSNEEPKKEDMNEMMQKQMTIMMPLMIGFFAFSFPIGLALYWNTYTIFGIIQQRHLNKNVPKK